MISLLPELTTDGESFSTGVEEITSATASSASPIMLSLCSTNKSISFAFCNPE
jgi:hypothetical protein